MRAEVALTHGYTPRRNCKVCSLGYDMISYVNKQLIVGIPAADISRSLDHMFEQGGLAHKVSYDSVLNHSKKHLPLKHEAVRRLIERRAGDAQLDIENGIENILQPIVVAEETMRRGFAALVKDEQKPTVTETLAAAKMLREFEREDAGNMDAAAAIHQVQKILKAVQEIVPAQYWDQIVARLNGKDEIEDAIVVQ